MYYMLYFDCFYDMYYMLFFDFTLIFDFFNYFLFFLNKCKNMKTMNEK